MDYSILNNDKVIIFGGVDSWQRKVKVRLPNITLIDGNLDFDKRLIKNADIIFINVKAKLYHGLYYKAKKVIKENNIATYYISTTNIDFTLKEMHNKLLSISTHK